jgi:hypothetical protein
MPPGSVASGHMTRRGVGLGGALGGGLASSPPAAPWTCSPRRQLGDSEGPPCRKGCRPCRRERRRDGRIRGQAGDWLPRRATWVGPRRGATQRQLGDTLPQGVPSLSPAAGRQAQRPRGPATSHVASSPARFSAVAATIPELPAGTLIADRYRVEQSLGRGAMGGVFAVLDEWVGERVALKLLATRDASSVERFTHELRLARRVTHKNIGRTFDIGQGTLGRFITMERVVGESLRALLTRRGRLPPDETGALMAQACAGVAAAHEAGVIHRDLKPGNVLLEVGGRVVVIDFGIAAPQHHRIDGEGFVSGTYDYMSPEQVLAAAAQPSDDVYALGLIAFELATASRPFAGGPTRGARAAARVTALPDLGALSPFPALERGDRGLPRARREPQAQRGRARAALREPGRRRRHDRPRARAERRLGRPARRCADDARARRRAGSSRCSCSRSRSPARTRRLVSAPASPRRSATRSGERRGRACSAPPGSGIARGRASASSPREGSTSS